MAWTTPRTWVTGETVTAAHLNAHVRDNFGAAFPLTPSWDDWTPTLTGIVQGNGTVTARYAQVGKTVHAYFIFFFSGVGSVMGSGVVTLPVTASGSQLAAVSPVGTATFHDATGPVQYHGLVRLDSTTSIRPVVFVTTANFANSSSLSATDPFTWASGDRLAWHATYEAA